MKKSAVIIMAALAAAFFSPALHAQTTVTEQGDDEAVEGEFEIPEGYELVDTIMYVPAIAVDSNLVGQNIFEILSSKEGGSVRLNQSDDIRAAMDTHFVHNSAKALQGYRVRIFFDNKQSSRMDSEATMNKFKEMFPEVPVYWSYVNPYFKLTVGDYRTRSEAMQLLSELKEEFPAAFIVREGINYPPIDKEHAMVLDTLKVLRALPDAEPSPGTLFTL